jgi:hypothetical protein
LPADLNEADAERLRREQHVWLFNEVWPKTPLPFLKGRTPESAAKAGDAAVPLRAALFSLESSNVILRKEGFFQKLRERLGIAPEPEIDPATVDIEQLHLARLRLVPAEQLDDDRLAMLHQLARRYGLLEVLERTSRILADRPDLWEKAGTGAASLFAEAASLEAAQGRTAEALDWLRRGRQVDPSPERAQRQTFWDMAEIRIRATAEPPEVWVPQLAAVLDGAAQDPNANRVIMTNLINMGLIEVHPNPDDPRQPLLDARPLEMLMAEYGPRVTTASGQLGVAAAKGGLWTPGSSTGGGGGGIWTPGSEHGHASGAADKPKLIVPGR